MHPIKVKEPWELIGVDLIGKNQLYAVICFNFVYVPEMHNNL